MPKYKNSKCTWGGEEFDSKKERNRWMVLSAMQLHGEISNLERQVEYLLIPAIREADTVGKRGGVKRGKIIEHPCRYVADFRYTKDGETIIEDVKSRATKTPQYIIKRKLMLWRFGLRIHEV